MSQTLGSSSHRAVLSPNGAWLAAIVDNEEIQIINTAISCTQGRVYRRIRLQDRAFAARVNTIRWSPEPLLQTGPLAGDSETSSEIDQGTGRSRILLSDGRYIQIYSTWETDRKRQVLLHLDMGDLFGRISYIDFAFDHRHAIILTEINIQATILTIDTKHYAELKTPKFTSPNSFAYHPKRRHISLLTRSDGKDIVTTYRVGEDSWSPEATIITATSDSHGILWSPDGRFLAVWDAPSKGCRIYFYTADGQKLDHMDITNIGVDPIAEDFEGLGIKTVAWFSSNNVLALTDFAGNVVLRRLDGSYRWTILEVLPHSDKVSDHSTLIYSGSTISSDTTQLTEVINRPFHVPSLAIVPTSIVPRTIEHLYQNSSGSMMSTTHAGFPSTVWIWQGIRSPFTVLNFHDAVKQMEWHPRHSDALIVITAGAHNSIYLWRKSHGVTSKAVDGMAGSGKLEVRWVGGEESLTANSDEDDVSKHSNSLKDEDYLFTLTTEKSFDLGFLENIHTPSGSKEVKYRSVLNEGFIPYTLVGENGGVGSDVDMSMEEIETPTRKRKTTKKTVAINAEHKFSTDGDPQGLLAQAPYHQSGGGW